MRDRNGRNIQVGDLPDWRNRTMTRDEIMKMQPGRELDVLVAEKVLWLIKDDVDRNLFKAAPRRYSTDNAATLEVATHLQKQGYCVCIELLPHEETSVGVYEADPANQIAYAKAQTPAEAICKAALLAVMEG